MTTTVTKFRTQTAKAGFDIQFNSVIPKDLKNITEILTTAKESGLISRKTGVEVLGISNDPIEELKQIEGEEKAKEEVKEEG